MRRFLQRYLHGKLPEIQKIMGIFDESRLLKTVTITLTQACNLNCVYCYEGHKSKAFMPFHMAKDIIDRELSKVTEDREVEIDLFGGEPLLNFPLIRQITEYVESAYANYNVTLFITTNGTLIDDEIKNWLERHPILVLGLSYDGTPQMQDMNRCDSSGKIDLNYFASHYGSQPVKMTITEKSLQTLSDGVIYLHEKGFQIACNLAYGIDWSDRGNLDVLERELAKLIEYYLDHPDLTPCSMLNDPISQVAGAEGKALRTCGAGWLMSAYNIDGKCYPCQVFMPLTLGERSKDAEKIVFPGDEISDEFLDEACVDCVLKPVCQRCYGSNYLASGNIYHQDQNLCELTKIIYRARAYFKAQLYERGAYDDCSDAEKRNLLQSILVISERL